MTYTQAIALRNELLQEGQYTEVYADKCSQHGSFGVEVIAVKTVPEYSKDAGRIVNRIIEETHFINSDRTGAIHI
jgi:hypothetical protein